LITKQGFTLKDLTPRGKPLETADLLLNIALTKSVINWLGQKHPALLLGLLLPIVILLSNIGAWALSYSSKDDDMMPHSYRLVLEKPE